MAKKKNLLAPIPQLPWIRPRRQKPSAWWIVCNYAAFSTNKCCFLWKKCILWLYNLFIKGREVPVRAELTTAQHCISPKNNVSFRFDKSLFFSATKAVILPQWHGQTSLSWPFNITSCWFLLGAQNSCFLVYFCSRRRWNLYATYYRTTLFSDVGTNFLRSQAQGPVDPQIRWPWTRICTFCPTFYCWNPSSTSHPFHDLAKWPWGPTPAPYVMYCVKMLNRHFLCSRHVTTPPASINKLPLIWFYSHFYFGCHVYHGYAEKK